MGFYMSKQSNREDYKHREYIVDTAADLANITVTDDAPGSTAFVVETGAAYMLNTEKQWKEL